MQTLPRNNYYDILELNANANPHEISTAYERAKSTYSGNNPAIYTIFSEQEARELLTLIEEAYQILGNKKLRLIYDQRLLGGKFQADDLSFAAIVDASKQMFPEQKVEEKAPTYKVDPVIEKEISHCEHWTGAFIKKVREYKHLSVQRMSDITKINPYYIKAIEVTDAKALPAVVFVRGYVVQIAKALHLDEKKVADSYMKHYKESLKD